MAHGLRAGERLGAQQYGPDRPPGPIDVECDHKVWDHLRTGNPIEGVFATVRHRTVRTKGALSQKTVKLMIFKLVLAAAKTWRRLKGANQLPLVIEGIPFTDGVAPNDTETHAA